MGRRKWKHYQDQLTFNPLNIAEQQPISTTEDSIYQKPLNHRLAQPNGQHCNNNNNNGALQFERDFEKNHTSHDHDSSGTSRSSSGSPSPPSEPNDWTPFDKCNFCVNGRLLTVNAKGELVVETTATASSLNCSSNSNNNNGTAEQQHDSDSSSSASLHNSSRNTNNNNNNSNSNSCNKHRVRNAANNATTSSSASTIELQKLLTQQAVEMTSMESMAAKLAQFSMMADFNLMSTLANQQHTNSVTPTTSEVSAAAASPALKDTPSPSADAPLDLSSKPSPNSSISGDIKTARALSDCATPISAARHSYSHEDLNSALQDVLVNKLGTRKAAKEYHVPRSALRNKLCKMSLDAKRPNAQATPELQQQQQQRYLGEQDESEEEAGDGDGDSNASTPALGYQEIAQRIVSTEHLHKLSTMSEHNGSELGDDLDPVLSPKSSRTPQRDGTPTDMQAAAAAAAAAGGGTNATGMPMPIDPTVLLNTLFLAAGFGVIPKLDETQTLGDLLKSLLMAKSGGMINEAVVNAAASGHESNGSASLLDQCRLQQQQQQQLQDLNAVAAYRRHLPKSETPETSSSLDANEACEDPILKIPSFKISGAPSVSPTLRCNNSSSSSMNNNNNNNSTTHSSSNRNGSGDHSPHSASPMLAAAVAAAAASNSYRHSGSSNTGNNLLSPSPTSIQKMMANTIQRKINEQSSQDSLRNNGNTSGSECSSSGGGGNSSASRKPSISVAKMIGGTDTSRFGASPNLLAQQHHSHLPPAHHAHQQQHTHPHPHSHSHQHQQLSAQDAAALAAGKGTRPKRGKYRNYDRDSLVEAVKAVQRGEMSVHRAGSYYGVPHSTLEYKVKERHLMRPRKREPKPQPDLVGLTGAANKISLTALNNLDKLKAASGSSSNATSSSGSKLSNALKSSSSSAASAAASVPNGIKLPIYDAAPQLSFQPNMFWPQTNAGANYALDFNRNPEFIKSHLAEVMRNSQLGVATNHHGHGGGHMKSALDFAENMYDGIIRKTLKNDGDVSTSGNGNALLDQLLVKKTPLPFTNNRSNDYLGAACSTSESNKRAGSPMGAYTDIKRERLSPMRSADSASSDDDHEHSNNNNNNNSDLAHNKNNKSSSNNNNNGSSSNNGNGRSRMTSRDSETDASSLKSEHSHSSSAAAQLANASSNKNKMMDLNGSNSVKFESEQQAAQISPSNSILHEKLAKIKAEQSEVHSATTEEQL
ncbi:putative uncharacterized protein DDB_G0277255 isoform X2 [Drosophila grimshawi]|nr:putative uncharacterized protein DDB_G0277255 isoform X2 [Drosophila grimshawi]